jgi:glutamate racemase
MVLRNFSESIESKPIGIFDSGVGGLTVVRSLRESLKGETLVYLGDTARVPYGIKSEEAIKRFAREDVEFLMRFRVKMVVAACHTVSSVALDYLKKLFPTLPIIGVLEPSVKKALQVSKDGVIGVIGTQATIESSSHESFLLRGGAKRVLKKSCPLFVPLAEEGLLEGEIPEKVAEMYLGEFKGEVDTLILGCTHYPLLAPTIKRVMGENVHLVDPSKEVAIAVKEYLEEKGMMESNAGKGELLLYLTDIPRQYKELIVRFLGEVPQRVEKAYIGGY